MAFLIVIGSNYMTPETCVEPVLAVALLDAKSRSYRHYGRTTLKEKWLEMELQKEKL